MPTASSTQSIQDLQTHNSGGQVMFDIIMGPIEPELTTAFREFLPTLYVNETPTEHTKRMERYRRAFDVYEQKHATTHKSALAELLLAREASRVDAEERSLQQDIASEQAILSQIAA